MNVVTRASLSALLLVASTATAAFAFKPAPESQSSAGITVRKIETGPTHVQGICDVGVNGVPAWSVNYLLPPNDAYYTFLDPASCAACGPTHNLQLTVAHVALNFINGCAQPISVGIWGAVNTGTCYVPDTQNLLCPTFNVLVQPGAGAWDIGIPIPQGCCIDGPAFLMFNFVANGAGCSSSATRPRLLTIDGCTPCVSYNIYPGGNDELCTDIGFPGNPIMYAEGECCQVVPALPKSWGTLKVGYR